MRSLAWMFCRARFSGPDPPSACRQSAPSWLGLALRMGLRKKLQQVLGSSWARMQAAIYEQAGMDVL